MIKVADTISLRLLRYEDAQVIFDTLDSEREYMRKWLPFVDFTHSVADTQQAMHVLADPENPAFGILIDGAFVGLIGFKDTDRMTRKTEIGYWLSQRGQGKGVMIRSVHKLLEYAFGVMEMNRVTIKVAVDNKPSNRIPQQLGFVKEEIERSGELLVDGVYTDIIVYSMLRKEYAEMMKNKTEKR